MFKDSKQCSWNFAFILTFRDKAYELYAPTRADRDHWVKILKTIAEMNTKLRLDTRNPIEYLKEQKTKDGTEEETKQGG